MPNKIQIKRSLANSVVSGLANGELAYTSNGGISASGGVLYIGNPDGGGTSVAIGGQRFPGVLTANQALVANSTLGIDKVIVANLVPTQIYANASFGTSGQVLHSGGAGNVYWANTTADITSVVAGAGLTGGGTDGAVTLDVVGANGISVAADSVGVTTGSTLTVNTTGIHVNSTLSITDLTLSGDLIVNGTLTTLDVNTLRVEDPLIELARLQANTINFVDSVDVGFYGSYGNTSNVFTTGLFRDASDSGVYKLFDAKIPVTNTTVDVANTFFTPATLQAYLRTANTTTPFVANSTAVSINSSRLLANSTVLNITANSTVSVTLTANSLSLTTALPATSGGTGTGTYALGDLLVGGAGNTLTKLTVGTDGKVLQSNGTSVVYADLDGGTF
jgi:hypothetical protein